MTAILTGPREVLSRTARRFFADCKSPPKRSMREFAEAEIVIPDGPFEGLKFSCERQPYTGLLYDAIDSGQWNRFAITGPTQSGKTLSACIVPLMYHLFEIGETVIFALPKMEMAADKWNEDLRPAIAASRYRDLLPVRGQGSRDAAKLDAVRFRNGATLKFMGGGGNDKVRAAFTSRVVVITETDGLDESGGNSREADKITQIEARTRAYGSRKRIYMECTVSLEQGRTWREFQGGTASKIILPCPYCRQWVTPEREQLVGWQDAQTGPEARQKGRFSCPACTHDWTEEERARSNEQARLLHRGQEITPKGKIVGDTAETDTLGFRWSAVNNRFLTAGDIASDEWRASRSEDEENAEKEMRQFVWAIPYVPPKRDLTDLSEKALCERQSGLARDIVPDDRTCLTLGVDVGKWRLHWVLAAWLPDGGGRIIDYGTVETAAKTMIETAAVMKALRELRDQVSQSHLTPQKELVDLDLAWVDAHWLSKTVKEFTDESGSVWQPSIGFGHRQYSEGNLTGPYSMPKGTGATVRKLGERYHAVKQKGRRELTWEFDADYAKAGFHAALACPANEEGAILLPRVAQPLEHQRFVRHLLAEKQVEEFVAGRGVQLKWESIRETNHWLDAAILSRLAALAFLKFGQVSFSAAGAPAQAATPAAKAPGGWFSQQRGR